LVIADGVTQLQTALSSATVEDLVVLDTQREDLGAPVRTVARVRIERLVPADVLVGVVFRVATRRPHHHALEEQRTELEAAADIHEPGVDAGRLLGAGRAIRRLAAAEQPRLPRAELVHEGRIELERPHAIAGIHADGVTILVHARARAIGTGDASAAACRGEGAVGLRADAERVDRGNRGGGGHTAPTLTGAAVGLAIDEDVRVH